MKRHRFDPVSAFFGAVFAGAALLLTLADERLFDLNARWLWPGILILAGGVLLLSGMNRSRGD